MKAKAAASPMKAMTAMKAMKGMKVSKAMTTMKAKGKGSGSKEGTSCWTLAKKQLAEEKKRKRGEEGVAGVGGGC